MALIKINVVRTESIQAGVATIDDAVNGFQTNRVTNSSAPIPNLGGNKDLITLVFQCLASVELTLAKSIGIAVSNRLTPASKAASIV